MTVVEKPLIVQSDRSVLLDVHSESYEAARDGLARFAELEKSPEHMHTYRITPLSLWNAAAAGVTVTEVAETLQRYAKYGVPSNVLADATELMGRFGKIKLLPNGDLLRLEISDPIILAELQRAKSVQGLLESDGAGFRVQPLNRGSLKLQLARLGYPVDDRVGFVEGEGVPFALRDKTLKGQPFGLRPYQQQAVDAFVGPGLGHGVIVLPCGAGKTVVGMGVAAAIENATLILCTNITSVRQWIRELLDKTTLRPEDIGEYSGKMKQIRPITITTYQIMSRRKGESFPHLDLFQARAWGLIIYDEVHLLPAPVFRVTAELQARRRLGLTATLVREDGLETDVFSLVGPKRCDVPWKEMEKTGFIAEAVCHEIRVPMTPETAADCAAAADEPQRQYRIAAESRAKDAVVEELLSHHKGEGILVIGQYVRQLERLARQIDAPLIMGKVPQREREALYAKFRAGEIRILIVSKVANFSIDLPDASVCIQVSGTYGSRQEEAQRLGRILRPKKRNAFFYSLVSRDSPEMRFAMHRQLFLTEQGYRYYIEDRSGEGRPPAPPSSDGKVIPFPRQANR